MQPVSYRYGSDPAQFGELTLPDGRALGTVVVLHGGFWGARYDLSLGRPLAADLAARGYAAWNLEYRRSGNGGGWPATFEDVAAGALAGRHYTLTVCSFALHLADVSRLPLLAWQLATVSDALLIVTPHKRPVLRPEWGWELVDEVLIDRVRGRCYRSGGVGER